MLHQHAKYSGYIATSSLQPIVTRLLAESDEPTYVYAYWPTIDTIAHRIETAIEPAPDANSAAINTKRLAA